MATLGIDLGGTYARAAVVDANGTILAADKVALSERSPTAVVESIAGAVAAALKLASDVPVSAIGVGAAGQLQGETGIIRVAPNLGWRDVPLGALLAQRFGRPVRVVNDLSAAAWGELKVGSGRGAQDLFVVFVGSGVGSAIIANGQLVTGASGVAGEFGHIKVVPNGRLCGCGERGCLEAYAGGRNLIAQLQEAIDGARPTLLKQLAAEPGPRPLAPTLLETAADAGDPVALEIFERAADSLALAVANQVTVLNPARLVLGGGTLARMPGLKRHILAGVLAYTLTVSREALTITDAELGDDSGIIGAALL
ncbi:MAG: ROK family protein, partial [Myxococcaceae bacterium]|nr:ROK family protein [Myxococcaceae bacterium]